MCVMTRRVVSTSAYHNVFETSWGFMPGPSRTTAASITALAAATGRRVIEKYVSTDIGWTKTSIEMLVPHHRSIGHHELYPGVSESNYPRGARREPGAS